MRNNLMRVVLVAISLVIFTGSILTGYMLLNLNKREIIEVNIGEDGSETVAFSSVNIKPGDSDAYVLALTSQLPGDCVLTMDFEEVDKGKLKKYLDVKIEFEGETLYEGSLEDLLEDENAITTRCQIKKRHKYEIKVTYSMPLEVGNDAKGAISDFLLNITLSNE